MPTLILGRNKYDKGKKAKNGLELGIIIEDIYLL
jgi:hypothetical protein